MNPRLQRVLLWAVLILVASSFPGKNIPDFSLWDFLGVDKIVHAFLYGIFTWLLLIFFTHADNPVSYKFFLSLFIGAAYGGVLELYQHYLLPDRSGDWMDFIADVTGCILALFFFRKFH